MSYSFENHPDMGKTLNDYASHEMMLRLLRDIRIDIQVCKIEGLDYKEYLLELRETLDEFLGGFRNA